MMRAFKLLASASKKNLVLMSVKSNLIQTERVADLKLFQAPWFVSKAVVAMGPAPADFTKAVKVKVLEIMKAEQDATLKNMTATNEYKKKLAAWEKATEEG